MCYISELYMRDRPIALCSRDSNTLWWWGAVTIMEAYRSVIMEAFRDRFTAAELLSSKEGLYDEATEEWYAPYDPDEVGRVERNCMRLARQFYHLVEEYRERLCTLSITNAERGNTSRELPLARLRHSRIKMMIK